MYLIFIFTDPTLFLQNKELVNWCGQYSTIKIFKAHLDIFFLNGEIFSLINF